MEGRRINYILLAAKSGFARTDISRGTPEYPVKAIWGSPQKRNRVSLNDLVERKNPFYEAILS